MKTYTTPQLAEYGLLGELVLSTETVTLDPDGGLTSPFIYSEY